MTFAAAHLHLAGQPTIYRARKHTTEERVRGGEGRAGRGGEERGGEGRGGQGGEGRGGEGRGGETTHLK